MEQILLTLILQLPIFIGCISYFNRKDIENKKAFYEMRHQQNILIDNQNKITEWMNKISKSTDGGLPMPKLSEIPFMTDDEKILFKDRWKNHLTNEYNKVSELVK